MSQIEVLGNAPYLRDWLPAMGKYPRQRWFCFSSPEAVCERLLAASSKDFWTQTGLQTLKTDTKTCLSGWREGAERVERLRERIATSAPRQQRWERYAIGGAIPDVQRYLAGDPQHMRVLQSVRARQRPTITLVNNIAGLCRVPDEAFANKAAVVAALVDSCEAAGYSCEVLAVAPSAGCEDPNWLCSLAFTVKEAGDTLDIAKLAFGLGHTQMWRGLGFAVYSLKGNEKLGFGHGRTVEVEGELPRATYLLPSLNQHVAKFSSEAAAATKGLEFAQGELARQGCPAFEGTNAQM